MELLDNRLNHYYCSLLLDFIIAAAFADKHTGRHLISIKSSDKESTFSEMQMLNNFYINIFDDPISRYEFLALASH